MGGGRCTLANRLWQLLCWPESRAFGRALRAVAPTQERYLTSLLRWNAQTDYGRRYDFASIRSVAEYQARVPLSTYDDYQPAIERIGAGEPNVLTRDPVDLLELTSGSSAPTKLIPYTARLKAEFSRAVAPWIADLFRHYPALVGGPAYWSVSPVTRRNGRSPGGIPIGFEDDAEYLGALQRLLVGVVQAVPPAVRLIADMESFRYTTLLFLLQSRELALISVWNPTFLTLLVEPLIRWAPALAQDLARGTLSPPRPLDRDLQAHLAALIRPSPAQAELLLGLVRSGVEPRALYGQLWPTLQLISCWTDSYAALYAPQVADLFPHATIQGKGLIATEGIVSLPLVGQGGGALALRSHFFEFLPPDGGSPKLAHELEQGERYAVALTTGGGLYRYQLHDQIEVVGSVEQCSLIQFTGKHALISDRFGEKVHTHHIQAALDQLFGAHAIQPLFAMVACEAGPGGQTYVLFIEAPGVEERPLALLAHDLERALQRNFHYRYCRDLGQLAPASVFQISGGALASYMAGCRRHGQRAGDIKPVILHRHTGWLQQFEGRLLGQPESSTAQSG